MVDTITFRCEACDTHLQAAGDTQARTIICHQCGAKVTVPVMLNGPPVTYDDSPPAPEVFRRPPVYVVETPDRSRMWRRIGLGISCLGAIIIIFSIMRGSSPSEPSAEAVARSQAQTRATARDQTRDQSRNEERADAAAQAARRESAAEMEKLQREKDRLQQEVAAMTATAAAGKPDQPTVVQPTEVVQVPVQVPVQTPVPAQPAPAAELPSYEQAQKDLRRANAEMLVARSKLNAAKEEMALTRARIATGQGDLDRAVADLRAQAGANRSSSAGGSALVPGINSRRGRVAVGTDTSADHRGTTASKLEDQLQARIGRLQEEQAKRTTHLAEADLQVSALEEELRLATERFNTAKDTLKQVAPAAPAPTSAPDAPVAVPPPGT